MNTDDEKTCNRCMQTQPINAFYKHRLTKDGHSNQCITCMKAYALGYRQTDKARIAKAERERGESYRATKKIYLSSADGLAKRVVCSNRYRLNHPDKQRARRAVKYAVSVGKLIPWPVCAMPECNDKPQAHHPDYSRPLDIVWLCYAHHMQAHGKPVGAK